MRKGLLFLIVSSCALALLLWGQVREAELRELELEREQQLQQLREMRQQLGEAADRLEDLENMLLNLQRMQDIVSRGVPSRGGRIDATTMPVTMPSGFSAARFERAFAGTGLSGIGETLVQAEELYGINSLVLAAITVHESGWGSSRLAQDKNNLAGLGAYDHSPGSAIRFENREECVMFLAELLRERPGSLEEIGTWYASDPRWAEKVAGCMRVIMQRAEVEGER